jgi:hypothetical protein
MPYNPKNAPHLRYQADYEPSAELTERITEQVLTLHQYLGYDFNTVEIAVRSEVPYAIDFCNPAPDADIHSIGEENFEWVEDTMARYAIERAVAQKPGKDTLTWGKFVHPGRAKAKPATATEKKKSAAPKAKKTSPVKEKKSPPEKEKKTTPKKSPVKKQQKEK